MSDARTSEVTCVITTHLTDTVEIRDALRSEGHMQSRFSRNKMAAARMVRVRKWTEEELNLLFW